MVILVIVSLLLVATSGDTALSLRVWTALVVAYAIFIFALAQWVSRDKAGESKCGGDK